jgi:hypothetical protein
MHTCSPALYIRMFISASLTHIALCKAWLYRLTNGRLVCGGESPRCGLVWDKRWRRLQWMKNAVLLLRCGCSSGIKLHSEEAVKTDGREKTGGSDVWAMARLKYKWSALGGGGIRRTFLEGRMFRTIPPPPLHGKHTTHLLTRVSQLKIWHFWVIVIERNVCRCNS